MIAITSGLPNAKWNFLREKGGAEKQMALASSSPSLIQQLGLLRLPNVEDLLGKQWVEDCYARSFDPFVHLRLGRLDNAIARLKPVPGFEKWKSSVFAGSNFGPAVEFELLDLAMIVTRLESPSLQPAVNPEAPHSPLAELEGSFKGVKLRVELKTIERSSNPKNKALSLLYKARKQIGKGNNGILLVNVSDWILNEKGFGLLEEDKATIDAFAREVKANFRGSNTRIVGVIISFSYIQVQENDLPKICNIFRLIHNPHNLARLSADDIISLYGTKKV